VGNAEQYHKSVVDFAAGFAGVFGQNVNFGLGNFLDNSAHDVFE
jgi:hypothetical protein